MISGTSFLYINRDFIELENILNDENFKNEKKRKENLGLEILELNESDTSCEKKHIKKPEALNKLNWSIIEEYIFFESHKLLGNKWSSIMKFLPDRSDNNLKNHFYSNLRKTLRRFIKEKFNFNDIKDKLKAYYSLIYIRDKLCDMQSNGKTSDSNENSDSSNIEENNKIIEKEKDENDSINLNIFDNIYIFNLLNKERISLERLENYLNKLCKGIITDFILLKISSDFLKKDNFNIEIQNAEDRKEFEILIKTFIFNQIVNRSFCYLKNRKNELSNDKYLRLIEFIRKYSLYKFKPNLDFENEIMKKDLNLDQNNSKNSFLINQNLKNIEHQINYFNLIENNKFINIPNQETQLNCLLVMQNLNNISNIENLKQTLNALNNQSPAEDQCKIQKNENSNILYLNQTPTLSNNINHLSVGYSNIYRNEDTFQTINSDHNKNHNNNENYINIDSKNIFENFNNSNGNALQNNNNISNIPNLINYYNNKSVNSLLGNKILRNNSFVNICETNNNYNINSNNPNISNNKLNTFNLIFNQNLLIKELLSVFNNFRQSMSNNICGYYPY